MTEPIFKTIANVPIVSTGKYHLAGNPYPSDDHSTTFTADDLRAAVDAAMNDTAVKLPRLKLGHESDWGEAEPAFGKVDNLRYDEDTETIFGDYVGTPGWLADVLPVVYPNRSIEALFGVTTPTGNEYRMVITAVALLGVQLPGVATLEDLAGLFTEEIPETVELEGEPVAAAMEGNRKEYQSMKLPRIGRKASAQTNTEDVRRAFYEEWAIGDQFYWWIREMFIDPDELIVDDGDGSLYRMSFSVSGDEIEFGEPDAVVVEYVAASATDQPKLKAARLPEGESAAVFASRSESRPESTAKEDQVELSAEQLKRLGLPEDASQEDVDAALEKLTASETPSDDPAEGDEDEEGGDDETEDEEVEEPAEPEAVTAQSGVVQVEASALAELQENAKLGRKAHERQEKSERDTALDQAVKAGKFPPARREHWQKLWDADPEGTRETIAELAEVIPLEARGGAPSEESESEMAYDPNWLTEGERARAAGKVEHKAGTVQVEA